MALRKEKKKKITLLVCLYKMDVIKDYIFFSLLSAAYLHSHCLACFSLFHCSSLKLSCHHLSSLLLLQAELLQGTNRNQNSKPFNELVAAVTKSTIFLATPPPPLTPHFASVKTISNSVQYVELGEPKTVIASSTTKK